MQINLVTLDSHTYIIIRNNDILCTQWSFCGNYSDARHHKHERPDAKVSVLQDNSKRIVAVYSKGKSNNNSLYKWIMLYKVNVI